MYHTFGLGAEEVPDEVGAIGNALEIDIDKALGDLSLLRRRSVN